VSGGRRRGRHRRPSLGAGIALYWNEYAYLRKINAAGVVYCRSRFSAGLIPATTELPLIVCISVRCPCSWSSRRNCWTNRGGVPVRAARSSTTVSLPGGSLTSKCNHALTCGLSARHDGVDDFPEPVRQEFHRQDATSGAQGLALGVVALLEHSEGLGGECFVQSLTGRAVTTSGQDTWSRPTAIASSASSLSSVESAAVRPGMRTALVYAGGDATAGRGSRSWSVSAMSRAALWIPSSVRSALCQTSIRSGAGMSAPSSRMGISRVFSVMRRTMAASSSARTQGLPAEYFDTMTMTASTAATPSSNSFATQAVAWADLPFIQPWADAQAGQLAAQRFGETDLVLAGVRQEHTGYEHDVVIHDRPGCRSCRQFASQDAVPFGP
jgi:hypothetical protein